MSAPPDREPPASSPGRASAPRDPWGLVVLFGVVVAGVWIVASSRFLPMFDASNHIATGTIASGLLHRDPFFAKHYELLPVPVPYWATTLALVALQPVVGPLRGFDLIMCAYVVALPLSFYLLLETAAPTNASLAAMAGLAAFSLHYWTGESNFLLGEPFSILGLALFLRLSRGRVVTLVAFLAVVIGCYLSHLYSLAVVLGGVLGLAVLSVIGARRGGPWAAYRFHRLQWVAAAVIAGSFLLAGYFVLLQHGHDSYLGGLRFDLSPRRVAAAVVGAAFATPDSHSPVTVRGLLVVILGFLAAPFVARILGGVRPLVNPQMVTLALVLVAATWLGPVAVLAPDGSVGEGDVSNRFGTVAFLFALGALPLSSRRSARVALAITISALAVVRLREVRAVHLENDAAVRDLEATVLARIPTESRVVAVRDFEKATDWDHIYEGLANYVVVERHGYSPHVFDVPGQQPLRHRQAPAYRRLSDPLAAGDRARFDYFLVQGRREPPQVPGLEAWAARVASAGAFRLYRVKPEASPSLPAP